MKFHAGVATAAGQCLLFLGLTTTGVWADPVTTYTVRSEWNGAVPGATVITFEGASDLSTHYPAPAVFGGVTFSARELFANAPALNYDSPHHQSTYLEWQNPPMLSVTLPGPMYAVAFDYGTFYGDIHTLSLVLPWGETIRLRTAAFSDRFFGLVSNRPLNGFALNDASGNFPTLDNFAFGHAAPVPEPASLLLTGAGLMWAVRRGKKDRRRLA